MPKRRRPWIVTRHGGIEKLEDNLWIVEGDIPGVPVNRRMYIIKRRDGRLMFAGAAIPLDNATLAEVKAWGPPAFLIVPHHWHMIDADAFAKRLGLAVYGPRACQDEIRKRTELTGTLEDLPPDPGVVVESVAGTKHGEAALLVTSGDGQRTSLLCADVIQNTPPASLPLPLRLLGFGGGPGVLFWFRLLFMRDRAALKGHLARWAALPTLVRVIPNHGVMVTHDPAGALRAAIAGL